MREDKIDFERKIYIGKEKKEIRKVIFESWLRSREYGLNAKINSIPEKEIDEFHDILSNNNLLIQIATDTFKDLKNIDILGNVALILCDAFGNVLKKLNDFNDGIVLIEKSIVEGANICEQSIGTSAVGISLLYGQKAVVWKGEHFLDRFNEWTSIAVPIFDGNNKLMGCLNGWQQARNDAKWIGNLLEQEALCIERQVFLQSQNSMMEKILNTVNEGILVIDENKKIINCNKGSCELLGYNQRELLFRKLEFVLKNDIILKKLEENKEDAYFKDVVFHNSEGKRIRCFLRIKIFWDEYYKRELFIATFSDKNNKNRDYDSKNNYKAIYKFEDIITNSYHVKQNIEEAKKVALTDCSILITGPSGTGKELFAESIHNYSKRKSRQFVAINCAALPEELIESELFGYEKGAFTGASNKGKIGKFELANGGTIFLDEIGEMPKKMQSKLLRVLDSRRMTRVGGNDEIFLNVRIIAATNRNLLKEIEYNNFRRDLYYRINVVNINLLSLDERKEDIELLTKVFINQLNITHGLHKSFTIDYINYLKKRSWPGNIRELRNFIERSYFLNEDLIDCKNDNEEKHQEHSLDKFIKEDKIMDLATIEKQNIINLLKQNNGEIVKTCRELNTSRATLYRKLKKYNISVSEMRKNTRMSQK